MVRDFGNLVYLIKHGLQMIFFFFKEASDFAKKKNFWDISKYIWFCGIVIGHSIYFFK